MNLEVVLDPYKIDKEGSSCIVETKEDYMKARLCIRDAILRDSAARIVIQNKGMIAWFKDLDRFALFKNLSPADILKSLLNRSNIPKIFIQQPKKIVDFNLIKLAQDNPIKPEQSSLDWILEATIRFPWIKESIRDGSDVYLILDWLIKNKGTSIDNVLVQLCIEKIMVWKRDSPYKEFLNWLAIDPFERAYIFCLSKLLQGYPDHKKALWLQTDGQWNIFCQLQNTSHWLRNIPQVEGLTINPNLNIHVREYLQERLKEEGLILGIIDELSGKLEAEESAIYNYISSSNIDKSEISLDIVNALQTKFKNSREKIQDLLNKLRPISPPPGISPNSNIDEVNIWIKKYFQYRIWCQTVEREDLLDEHIKAFEDWVINNYNAQLFEKPEAFVYGLRKTVYTLLEEGAVLFVIIDSLSWQWADYLIASLRKVGVYIEKEPDIRFSLLPSISEVSKSSIICGLLPSDTKRPSSLNIEYYDQLFKHAYSKFVGEKVIATDSSDTLFGLLREDSDIYLYLFNEIDEIVHQYNETELRDSKIKKTIDSLSDDIQYVLKKYDSFHKRRLRLVIIGDHGYLSLPKSIKKYPLDESITSHHGRVAEDVEIDGCHFLKIAEKAYSLARGFDIIGKKPRGCVHGGLTPDEMIVPFMIFSTKPLKPAIKPELAISGEIRRGNSECQLSIKIINPNPYKLSISEIDILFTTVNILLPIEIPPAASKIIEGILDASQIIDATVTLRYRIKAISLGQDNDYQGSIEIETIGAALVDKAFEEDFDV
jgi:hypothetical protein